MKKSKKKPVSVLYSDILTELDAGHTAKQVAEDHGVSTSTVYNAIKKRRASKATAKQPAAGVPTLSMSIQLPGLSGPVEVKLRNGGGELLGTLLLEGDGLSYRRPNQKSPADRKITWAILDKLMQLGIG